MSITRSSFGEYYLYTIENAQGARLEVTDLGATVRSIVVPDRNGVMGDVVLGYDTPGEYLDNDGYFGAAVGRYANRIAGAEFSLDGNTYKLTANEGKNTLHGGAGFSKRRFDTVSAEGSSVIFEIRDPDGGDGFPGNITVRIAYELTEDNDVFIYYGASSDRDTVINLTNHCYFNLRGEGDILNHELLINADYYLPVDGELIPTGGICPVEGTEFDFRDSREIKNGFYDHCFVLNNGFCAMLSDNESGRVMLAATDMPAVQFYAGGATGERRGKNGARYGKNSGLCLETQFFPDSPNRPDFPSCILKAGELFTSRTVYSFTVK